MKLNRKGFTLIEALAVIIILSMLMVITVPNVNKLINRQKDDALKNTEKSIISAAKIFFSDYKYEVTFSGTCSDDNTTLNITRVETDNNSEITLTENSKLPIKVLKEKKYLKVNKEGNIENPTSKESLNMDNSYITVNYSCKKKEFTFKIDSNDLKWGNNAN